MEWIFFDMNRYLSLSESDVGTRCDKDRPWLANPRVG